MEAVQSYISANKERYLKELIDFLKIPSVSANPAHDADVRKTAAFVKMRLEAAGVDSAEICETPKHPIVYAQKMIDPKLPTILVYGHYDVQPADPLELWSSPPFEPKIKKTKTHPQGAIFARGSCDDKGQTFMHVAAFEAMVKNNALP